MMTLYGQASSGNCYKPRLLMAKLAIPFRHVETSAVDGSTRTERYLALNPNGQVPLLETADGRHLAESNAILAYLAEDTRFIPADRFQRGLMWQWMFFEQYSHEPHIAVRRALTIYPERAADATPERMAATLKGGNRALSVMDTRLSRSDFLAGATLTIADIALYAYTHEAPRGGFDLGMFPAVEAWLARVASDPGHVPIDWHPEGSVDFEFHPAQLGDEI